jgi:hypothetical protein
VPGARPVPSRQKRSATRSLRGRPAIDQGSRARPSCHPADGLRFLALPPSRLGGGTEEKSGLDFLSWVEKEKIRFSFKGVKRVDALEERIHRS